MLKPYKEIGIVYGHSPVEPDFAVAEIERLRKQGYRVVARRLKLTEVELRKISVFDALEREFRNIDAALVFMTGDDFAIPISKLVSDEHEQERRHVAVNQLARRARQNVVFELGYVAARFGAEFHRIFAPPKLEFPSDIFGHKKFVHRDLSTDSIALQVRELVTKNLKLSPMVPAIEDRGYRLEYHDILSLPNRKVLDQTADVTKFVKEEFLRLDLPGDRLVYIFERIVFDSYYAQPGWWRELIAKTPARGADAEKIRLGKAILAEVLGYMDAWQPPHIVDYKRIRGIADRLESLLARAGASRALNPLLLEVGYDYLGLALHKLGSFIKYKSDKRAEYLKRSCRALERVIALAGKHDDTRLPLWAGYARFNLARAQHQLAQLRRENGLAWRALERKGDATFEAAIGTRRFWTTSGYVLPLHISEGLGMELLHASVQWLQHATRRLEADALENTRTQINESVVRQLKNEYEDWFASKRLNLRLAVNIRDAWAEVDMRLANLSPQRAA